MFEVASANKTTTSKVSAKTNTATLQKKSEEHSKNPVVSLIANGKTSSNIQAKLTIGNPDDNYEKEADSTAEKVTSGSQPLVQLKFDGTNTQSKGESEEEKEGVQRKSESEKKDELVQKKQEEEEQIQAKASAIQLKSEGSADSNQSSGSGIEGSLSASQGGGNPLSSDVRDEMETGFGADFSSVRIHTGSDAVQMNSQINAKAFTHENNIYFNQGRYNPNTSEGKNLIAHELTHTIQQGAAKQHSQAQLKVQRKTPGTNNNSTIQRSWLSNAWNAVSGAVSSAANFVSERLESGLNWIKNQFKTFVQNIPGYKLLSVVLGQDPIAGTPVARNGRNFIEAGLDIIPFGNLFKQKLEEAGALEEAAGWLDRQIAAIDISLSSIMTEISAFWNSLSLKDIGNVSGVLERAANIIRRPIGQIFTFASNVANEFLRIVKKYVLTALVLFIKNSTTAYPLLTVILGKDPITDEPVERTGMNLIRGFILLSPDGEEQLRQMEETGTLQKAADWVDTAVAELNLSWNTIKNLFTSAWNLITIENLMQPLETFQTLVGIFAEPAGRIISFVIKVGLKILEFIKDALLARLSIYAMETRGYPLITVLLGKDPFTQEPVERSPENIIHGFMSLMDGGEEQFQQMKESGAIQRTIDWIEGAVAALGFTWEYITGLFISVWNSFSIRDLAAPFEAFARIVNLLAKPILRLVAFVWEVIKKVIEVLLIIMNFPIDLITSIISSALEAIDDIKRDPIGFLRNILRAIKQGFVQFFDNIIKHLIGGLVGWLTSELKDAGVPELKDLSLKGILSWVLEVLGITMEKIWEKLAKHPKIGPERVEKIRGMINTLTGIWEFIKDVQERGIAAIWDKIKEQLTNLWDIILNSVKNWVVTQIVEKVVTKLLSMLDPTGIMAVINSAIAIYNAVQSFVKYLRQMLEIINSFVQGVAEIAKGNITKAADFLEGTLARGIPIVIGFLANQVGLSGIGKRIGELIGKARDLVDKALDWLVNKAVELGSGLLEMGKAAVGTVMGWLGLRKNFKGDDGEEHSIYFSGSEENAKVMFASSPTILENFLTDIEGKPEYSEASKKELIREVRLNLAEIEKLEKKPSEEAEQTKTQIEQKFSAIAQLMSQLVISDDFGSEKSPIPMEYPKRKSSEYPILYLGPHSSKRLPQNVLESKNKTEIKNYLTASEVSKWQGKGEKIDEFKPHERKALPFGEETIGIIPDWQVDVGKRIKLKPQKTKGGGLINSALKPYGYSAQSEKLDGDHVVEMQLGGPNILENLWPLDMGENRSSGSIISTMEFEQPNNTRKISMSDLKKQANSKPIWLLLTKTKT